MTTRAHRRITIALPLALLWAGCDGGDDDNADVAADDGRSQGPCVDEARDDFAIGVVRQGAWSTVTIADATPSDPVRADNGWTVAIERDQAVVEDVEIEVKLWMPDHGHGTGVHATVTPMGDGQYMLEPLNLFMAGLWEITLVLTLPDETTDEVMFSACVQ